MIQKQQPIGYEQNEQKQIPMKQMTTKTVEKQSMKISHDILAQ